MEPVIVQRAEHCISRQDVSPEALKVLYGLKEAGYIAYIAGGGVRDLLLGRKPKDFDIVTDATPNEVRRVFRNCRLIGRRFRLAHVFYGSINIEVATFRSNQEPEEEEAAADRGLQRRSDEGVILRDADILEQLGAAGILRTVSKVGRDTRFITFADALRVLERNLRTLPGLLRLDSTRAMAVPYIECLHAFIDQAQSEAGSVAW